MYRPKLSSLAARRVRRGRHTDRTARDVRSDAGAILPLVIVATFVVSTMVIAVTTYVTADLRYARVVEDRADRLAAADGGLRFGVEKLRNFQTLCATAAGTGGGVTTVFPPVINGATTAVTCRRIGQAISDVQGWGVVVTASGVPAGQSIFSTSGAGQSDNIKTFSGPVYIADPNRMDLNSLMEIKDGDLWFSASDCDNAPDIDVLATGDLRFEPDFFRGPLCTEKTWSGGLFTAPTASTPPVSPVNPGFVDTTSCRVFSPGKYTSIALAQDNYFNAGLYYFENTSMVLQGKTVVAGFPDGAGDSPKLPNTNCAVEQEFDKQTVKAAGGTGGATFYLGGNSHLEIRNNAGLEIFRRRVNETYLSVFALGSSGAGYTASTIDWNSWLLETKSGSNNDVAIHGLMWAPQAAASLGNITNAANGQLLGGIVVARLDTQASASATGFLVGIGANPVWARLLLTSTSTLKGRSVVIRAVVQFRPDTGDLAVNSWRVQS